MKKTYDAFLQWSSMGDDYKNGIAELDGEQLYRLEKFR